MFGRDVADEHRARHAQHRRHADHLIDGAGDCRQQSGPVRPAQGEPIEAEKGTARVRRGGKIRGEAVQRCEKGLADPGRGLLVNRFKDGVWGELLGLVETHALDHALGSRLGGNGPHTTAVVRESSENQRTAPPGRRLEPGGEQRRMGHADAADHGIG